MIQTLIDLAPLGIVVALLVPLLLGIAARPQVGVLLLVAVVPYNGLLTILKHPPFSEGYKQYLTVYVAVWALFTTVRSPNEIPLTLSKRHSIPGKRPRYLAPLAFYVAVALFSALRVGGTSALVGLQTSFFYVLIPIALWWCPLNRKERDWFISILMFNGFISACYGLYQQRIGQSGLLDMGYEYGKSIRTTGPWLRSFSIFGDPQSFALFLMLVLLICVPVALDEIERTRSKVFLATTPVLLFALAFTFGRSAWLGLAFGTTYLAFHRYRVLLFFAPFALPLIILLPGTFGQGAFYKGSLDDRQAGWAENLNHAADPFGNGIGTTGSAAEKVLKITAQKTGFYQPDNNYFKVLYELGILGLFFFIMTLVASLLFARDAEARAPPEDRGLLAGATAFVLAVIVAGFTSNVLEIFPSDVLFWTLLGVVASCRAVDRGRSVASQSRST